MHVEWILLYTLCKIWSAHLSAYTPVIVFILGVHIQGFGVVMSEEQRQLIGQLEAERSHLLELMTQLETDR